MPLTRCSSEAGPPRFRPLAKLPLLPLSRPLLPGEQRTVFLYERPLVAALEAALARAETEQVQVQGGGPDSSFISSVAVFGHVLQPEVGRRWGLPPGPTAAAAEAGSSQPCAGWERGCLAAVLSAQRRGAGDQPGWDVTYEGLRRFRILAASSEPDFCSALVDWVDDDVGPSGGAGNEDALESRLYWVLRRLCRLTNSQRAAGQPARPLPSSLRKYAPPALPPAGLCEAAAAAEAVAAASAAASSRPRHVSSFLDSPSLCTSFPLFSLNLNLTPPAPRLLPAAATRSGAIPAGGGSAQGRHRLARVLPDGGAGGGRGREGG